MAAALLVAGVVMLWTCELNLMKGVSKWEHCNVNHFPPSPPAAPTARLDPEGCPWHHPVFVGTALKMVFVVLLPPALLARWCARRGEIVRRPLVDRQFFLLSGVLALFLLGTYESRPMPTRPTQHPSHDIQITTNPTQHRSITRYTPSHHI